MRADLEEFRVERYKSFFFHHGKKRKILYFRLFPLKQNYPSIRLAVMKGMDSNKNPFQP